MSGDTPFNDNKRERGGDGPCPRDLRSTADFVGPVSGMVSGPPTTGTGERPGDSVGPYTLLNIIGEGGFGTVWLAERREPMVQRVALKIIKPGMDSKAVVARFEQERQALAVMDHPNVARVFDGGVTERGRPYFIMEHVQGEPITSFADRRKLTLRQRLELFIPVCEAVQHAHHKGLIHRDIKPSNVLVAEIEGKPVPKVIDFGVAKAIASSGWEHTAHTQSGMVIGTPEYMSPEQVAGEIDVDTRSDVYALGVLLYELLTGELPFDSGELRKAALAEIQRIIREVTPPKPSTRLVQLAGDRTTTIAEARSASRDRLTSELRRELDWIPLMALRKERERRYPSPQALADDVQRYLDGRPLRAAPDSRAYLAKKFVRRNKVQVFAAAAVFVALSAGLGVALWQRNEAITSQRAELERADQLKQVSDFQTLMLSQIDTTKAGVDLMADVRSRFEEALKKEGVPEEERDSRLEALRAELVRVNATDTAAAMIDRTILKPAVDTIGQQFKDQPVVGAQLRQALADLYRDIGLFGAAMPLQESALHTRRLVLGDAHPDTISSMGTVGVLLLSQGRLSEAEPFIRESHERSREVLGSAHDVTLRALNNTVVLLQAKGNLPEAESVCRDVVEGRRRFLGEDHPDTLASLGVLGGLLAAAGKYEQAEPLLREAMERHRRVLGEDHPHTLTSINNLGYLLEAQCRYEESERLFREGLERSRRVLGEEHPDTLGSLSNLGAILQDQGRLSEAQTFFRDAFDARRRALGLGHPDTLQSIINLGYSLRTQGELIEAETLYRTALDGCRRVLGEDHSLTLVAISNLGGVLEAQERLDEAEPFYLEAMTVSKRVNGNDHPDTLGFINNMGFLLVSQGKVPEAEPFFREALERGRALMGAEHPQTLGAVNNIGYVLGEIGKPQEAIEIMDPATPAAREAFARNQPQRLAAFLLTLARCRLDLGYAPDRFALAESHLVEALPIYMQTRGPTHSDTLACVQALVDLYTAWHTAEPGKGYDAKSAEWQAKLPPPETAPPDAAAASPPDRK